MPWSSHRVRSLRVPESVEVVRSASGQEKAMAVDDEEESEK